ncbi:MAG: hypothetical protein IKD94_00010 [Erysipelotrichaceae bacterium]|nr:hypothetical protein [Erysipelotrichaceae bacterium]
MQIEINVKKEKDSDKNYRKVKERKTPSDLTVNKKFKKTATSVWGYEPTKTGDSIRYLFLGTIPSKAGYEEGFYYLSDSNQFYRMLDETLYSGRPVYEKMKKDKDVNKLETKLLEDGIVLFDTLRYCERLSSLDSDIIRYSLHTSKEFEKLIRDCPNLSTIIFTSSLSKRFFREIFALKENERINDKKMKQIFGKNIAVKTIPSPSGFNSSNYDKAIEKLTKILDK